MHDHDETEIEMVQRHIGEAEAHLRQQVTIIGGLRRNSALERIARQLLISFETTLNGHRQQLARLVEGG